MAALDSIEEWLYKGDSVDVIGQVAEWSSEGKYAFDERAGILEFDGSYERMKAEQLAFNRLKTEFKEVRTLAS
jgi:hypothetical protein